MPPSSMDAGRSTFPRMIGHRRPRQRSMYRRPRIVICTTPLDRALTHHMDVLARTLDLRDRQQLLHALQAASTLLTQQFGTFYSAQYCAVRLGHLRVRYNLFIGFLEHPGIAYKVARNDVFVSMSYWRSFRNAGEGSMFSQLGVWVNHFLFSFGISFIMPFVLQYLYIVVIIMGCKPITLSRHG